MPSDYFTHNRAPAGLVEIEKRVIQFLGHQSPDRKLAVVTSGGTTVPLENNTVRFLDNFSTGTRGALCSEYLLNHDYAVIFLYRESSQRPFMQHYSHKPLLDWLEIDKASGQAVVKSEFQALAQRDIQAYNSALKENRLLELPFVSINEYLYLLRMLGFATQKLGPRVLFLLAAAVSDFYLPQSKVSEHKIQSHGASKLAIDFDPVPKLLGTLVHQWAPKAFVISFKLETDERILLSKCSAALEKYSHHAVVGNLLHTRRDEVHLVTKNGGHERIVRPANEIIENIFMPALVQMHAFHAGQ